MGGRGSTKRGQKGEKKVTISQPGNSTESEDFCKAPTPSIIHSTLFSLLLTVRQDPWFDFIECPSWKQLLR